ncbi:hypothetical protein GE09DRAFT_1129802 [Coniochaeta sp. 2T2.1]|nr:hypothetical protein GE09DRAFT_1129802 [Coniochaeta sp. 2T2.1]
MRPSRRKVKSRFGSTGLGSIMLLVWRGCLSCRLDGRCGVGNSLLARTRLTMGYRRGCDVFRRWSLHSTRLGLAVISTKYVHLLF